MTGRVVVIGGGITGLAAAWALCTEGDTALTVLEADHRPGGKIATEPFAGIDLDTGPDAFLTRTPSAVELCRAVGLGPDLVAPATGVAYLWSRGRLRRLPEGTVLGVPLRLGPLARSRVLSPWGTARVALDLALPSSPPVHEDRSVASVVRPRLGAEAHLRLVDSLVGGINAGRTEELSLAVAAPQLSPAASSRSLVRALRAARSVAPPAEGPVFSTVRGGLARLVDELSDRLGQRLALGEGAVSLSRAGGAWEVVTTRGRRLVADAVIVAVPAPAAGQLLANASPTAAAELGRIEYASVALVTLAYPRSSLGCALDGSGFLVPRVEGRLLTACSWVNSKWPHLDPKGAVVLRASAGRHRDRRALDLDDATLVDRLHAELTQAMGLSVRPTDARVHRWEGAFPQFAVGHLDRVARIEAALAVDAPGVTVAGAALRGVGLPTCIAGAQAAARRATQHLAGLAA